MGPLWRWVARAMEIPDEPSDAGLSEDLEWPTGDDFQSALDDGDELWSAGEGEV